MSYNGKPLVSIIMPCYNDGQYIPEAIESIKAQTYAPIELIVIDDGSDDENTKKILSEIDLPDYQLLHTNRGFPAVARNKGIEHARGKYILPLDADDRIEPAYIEKAVEVLESRSDVGAVYCRANYFGAKQGPWELPDFDVREMLIDNVVFVTALIRKQIFDEVGGFDVTFVDGLEDYDFFLSLLEKGWNIHQIPEYLFNYRIKPTSRSTQFVDKKEAVSRTYKRLYNKHAALYQEHMKELFPALREQYLSIRNEGNHAKQEAELLRNLVYEKGLKAFVRLLYYRYKR